MERKTYVRFVCGLASHGGFDVEQEVTSRDATKLSPPKIATGAQVETIYYQFYDRVMTTEVVDGQAVLLVSGPIKQDGWYILRPR